MHTPHSTQLLAKPGKLLLGSLLTFLVASFCVHCSNRQHNTDVPDIKGKLLNNDSASVREIAKNKLTLVNAWGIFCGPCMQELPILHDVYDKYKEEENFAFITVAMDSEAELNRFLNPADTSDYRRMFDFSKLKSFYLPTLASLPNGYSKLRVGYAIVQDSTECHKIQKMIKSNAVPTTLIYDYTGKLVFKKIGSFEDEQLLTKTIDSLLVLQ